MNIEIVIQLAVLASVAVSGPSVIALLAIRKGNL
uniref:Photosystem II reaction center protein Psb30 n=1 Tax=Schizaea elegans TaxID=180990 RepID=A0A286QHG2_9MONI|nr:conserved hypothetical protein Ycf12 [Schizaea elegans]YP_010444794.1 conserved hypothetical chloroplast protein Ycf12 [Schizaea dichotoma]YP_010444969.1 conserved hypothetical chloroplast protein Ycf12 [Schizaea sprucei]APT66045.1 conserved hypothetical protein Ycf12 [Schizaea elegans]UTJ90371.1 conserved hypothetical chloroplast protein Ycf12 [Schizaea dichotoma]UTJ90535.1 conserved hypothetical chloroplast protein Ycf12 [Schizaea sprucei]